MQVNGQPMVIECATNLYLHFIQDIHYPAIVTWERTDAHCIPPWQCHHCMASTQPLCWVFFWLFRHRKMLWHVFKFHQSLYLAWIYILYVWYLSGVTLKLEQLRRHF